MMWNMSITPLPSQMSAMRVEPELTEAFSLKMLLGTGQDCINWFFLSVLMEILTVLLSHRLNSNLWDEGKV